MAKKPEDFIIRQWLNPKKSEDSGFVRAVTRCTSKGGNAEIQSFFELGDCSRRVNLAFDAWSFEDEEDIVKQAERRLIKLRAMKEIIEEMEEHYKEAYTWAAKEHKKAKKKGKK